MFLWKRWFGDLNLARQGKCKPGTGKKHVPGKMRGKDMKIRKSRTVWTPDRLAELKSLRESGKTFQACADAMGLKRCQAAQGAYAKYVGKG